MLETLPLPAQAALGLIAGGLLLLWGADTFMDHIADLARHVGLPVLAMGLLLAGAEPEEMATAVIASAEGHPVLAATDALGANVTMTTLGLGLALFLSPVVVTPALRRYTLGAVAVGFAALAAVFDGHVGRVEGALLIALFVAFVAAVWIGERRPPAIGELAEDDDDDDGDDGDDDSDDDGSNHGSSAARTALWVAAGFVAMVAGGALAVDGAAALAQIGGLGQEASGLSALAFATSVEVLALVVAARRRDLTSVAIGGVVGAVLYNATLTLGVSALVAPMDLPDLRWVALLAAVLPLLLLVTRRGRVVRAVGAVLVAVYIGYLVVVLGGGGAG